MMDVRVAFADLRVFSNLPRVLGDAIDEGLAALVRRVLGMIERGTPVGKRKHPEGGPGTLKGSWETEIDESGDSVLFGTDIRYAPHVETGSGWPTAGPRTKDVGGAIYSRQAPGGILGPFAEDTKLVDEIFDVIVDEIVRGFERA